MSDFEVDTRLERIHENRLRATFSRDWEIWGPSGGYVASIALRAAGQIAKVQRLASFSGHFLAVGRFDTVDIEVRTLRAGRRAESARRRSARQADRSLNASFERQRRSPVSNMISPRCPRSRVRMS